jgi:DNA-binding SARP family transcriptional activator/predicted ATPase
MGHLALSFFGAFQATLGDKLLTKFRSAKVQGLLVYLALTFQRPHGRDVLAALFWPDEPESVARQNLRQSLYRLRKVLVDTGSRKEPFLLVTRSTVQFNAASDHALDVASFLSHLDNDQLEPAVSLYQGELLPGFNCDSLPFEEWLRQERERLHRLALNALFSLTAHSLDRADYHRAQSLARRQLVLEPWREEAHRQLMQALALLGERSAALVQYETCRTLLKAELGIAPAAETETLAAQIRDQQRADRSARRRSDDGQEHRRLSIPFVGRSAEYIALVEAYRRAGRDGLQVVTLSGRAGIGKTRLAQHFLEWAVTQGADVLRGRAFGTSGGLPYQPLTQVLRQRLERENAPEDLLSDLWLTQLTRLLPELRDRYPDLPEPTQEEAIARQHLFEAVTRLGQALAKRAPLVLFIDDWHWADAASLDVLHYATLRWAEERMPILVLLTLRQEALPESPDLQTWLARLKHNVGSVQLSLGELSQAETEQLIRSLLEPEAGTNGLPADAVERLPVLTQFSHWLFEETDGQPLFLTETLKALVEDGLVRPDRNSAAWQVDWPTLEEQGSWSRVLPGVQAIIRGWLGRISVPAGGLLAAASVLAQNASFDHLCRVAGLEENQAMAALDELLGQQLLLEGDEALPALGHDPVYSFSHQKVSEVVYAEAGTARRRMLHRRAFEALQETSAPPAECAHHALNAGLVAETIRYSLEAGNAAMDIFAVRVAVAHYETAWQVAEQKGWPEEISGADRQALYTGLGRAYELTGDWPRAQETYEGMITAAQTMGAAAMECLGLNRLATIYINSIRDRQQAIVLLEQARTVAEQNGDRRGLAEIEWNLALAARLVNDAHVSRHHGEQALTIARELEHPQLVARCLNLLSYANTNLRQWETVEACAAEARDLYAAAGNQVLAADSQRMVGWARIFSGRPQEALATLLETCAFSHEIENLWGETDCAYKLALTRLELGHYGQAIRLARQAVEQARRLSVPGVLGLALSIWGCVQRTLMAIEPARVTLLELAMKPPDQGILAGLPDWTPSELCTIHALANDWVQAYGYAKQVLRLRGDDPLPPVGFSGWYETEALLRGGDGDLARAEVERLGKIVGDNKRYRLPLLRSQAVLAQWAGDRGQAITHLQAALALAYEIGLPGEEWSILGALGALYVDQGDQTRAEEAYRASAAIILQLAGTIDEEDFRAGFLAAEPIQAILVSCEAT